ncbi:hypothetical protein H7Y21_02230 [Arenimonas sp.]|nr:hypothetical protein [Candidatus Parcubacteria bacterium]
MKAKQKNKEKQEEHLIMRDFKPMLPSEFVYLDEPLQMSGFNIVAYTTIKTESGLRVAVHITSSTTCTCGGESCHDVTDIMSELKSAGFKPVPTGISGDLPLHDMPKNTLAFLRCHTERDGLGNYLPCSSDGLHRPVPIARYAQIRVPIFEELTIVVDYNIPTGIFQKFVAAAMAS